MSADDTCPSAPLRPSPSASETSPTPPIQVLVADDQKVARLGTRQVLSAADIEIVAEVSTTADALRLARVHTPDVIITEMILPDGRGTDLVSTLNGTGLRTPVLILSAYRGRENLEAFLDSDAAGYLLKQDDPSHLLQAVRGIKQGTLGWFSTRVARRLLALRRHELEPNGTSLLTTRERSLLSVLAQGESNRTIATTLGLSVGTVKNYLTSLYEKLGVDSRTKAIVWAHDHGLVG